MEDVRESKGEIESGSLVCDVCKKHYPILNYIPRFVPAENYANNFGLQWHKFRQTQLDSYSGQSISSTRFFDQTGWNQKELEGKTVLDVGCGAGRFAEIALSCGANLVALDYSSAIDACWLNLAPHPRLNLLQADIYALPFRSASFDFVYCLGVLQHTPDVKAAFMALTPMLVEGGEIAVDLYLLNWSRLFHPKNFLRPFTTRISAEKLFPLVEQTVPILLPISRLVGGIPGFGRYLKRLIPVANYHGVYPLSDAQLLEWAILDTYDWLGPQYDQPQTAATLRQWMKEAELSEIEVFKAHHLTGRGRKIRRSMS